MELKRYYLIIRRWWWLVALCIMFVTLASFVFSISQPPQYRSSVTLVVSPKKTIDEISAVRQSLDTLDNPTVINTYSEVIRSRLIYNQAQDSLELPADERGTVAILADAVQRTNLIRIDAEGTNPRAVFDMANGVTDEGIAYINNLYDLYDVKVLDPAQMPSRPFSPNVLRDVALGAVLGLMLGIMAAFLAEYMRRPFDNQETLAIVDSESGLYNQRYFLQRLREEINRAKRNKQPLATCLISLNELNGADMDQSKDSLPTIRRQVASSLKRQMRQGEVLARWPGNRMAWLMLDADEGAARQAVRRLDSRLERAVFENDTNGEKFFFTGNYGVVVFSDGMNEGDVMLMTENALQQAEANHGGPVVKSAVEPDSNSDRIGDPLVAS